MNLIDKRKYQEQLSKYETKLDEVSMLLINKQLQDEDNIRDLLKESYAMVGTTKILLNQSQITMERDL